MNTTTEKIGNVDTTENVGEWNEADSEEWRQKRIKEMIDCLGKRKWQRLPSEHQEFFIHTAGIIDFGFPIDIKKAYKYDPYD